ncbi:MAG: hypothetical protein JKY15_02020 [Deltaproteobacteria bacterium]|nr:hypothetical protein [Deltaproteobacteria bacterium]
MSSEQIYTPFLTIAYLKHSLKLNEITAHDDKLIEIIDRSNEQLDNAINSFIITPVDGGDAIYSHCRTAALRYAKFIWADEELLDLKRMETYEKLYDEKIETIITELKSRRNDKTKAVLVTSDPRDAKIVLPSQASIFVTEDF